MTLVVTRGQERKVSGDLLGRITHVTSYCPLTGLLTLPLPV